jgi:hypothetical protein
MSDCSRGLESPAPPHAGISHTAQRFECHGVLYELRFTDGTDQRDRISDLFQKLFPAKCVDANGGARLDLILDFGAASPLPARPPEAVEFAITGEITLLRSNGAITLLGPHASVSIEAIAGHARFCIDTPFWSASYQSQRDFMFSALQPLLRSLGFYPLHASAVSFKGASIIASGPPGSGKTTLSLALIRAGWTHHADGSVLLRDREGRIESFAYRRGHACTQQTLDFVRKQRMAAVPALELKDGKRHVDFGDASSADGQTSRIPRLLLFPEIAESETTSLQPVSDTEAILRLIDQSMGIASDAQSGAMQMQVLKRLVEQSESFSAHLGRDVLDHPANVSHMLHELLKESYAQSRNRANKQVQPVLPALFCREARRRR